MTLESTKSPECAIPTTSIEIDLPPFSLLSAELRLRIREFAIKTSWTSITLEHIQDNQDRTVGTHPLTAISQTWLASRPAKP